MNHVDQAADAFPPAGVSDTRYYLDGRLRPLTAEPASEETTVGYDSQVSPALVSFVTRFDEETRMVGYPKARSGVECD